MKNKIKKTDRWIAIRKQINDWDKPILLKLVKNLYEISPKNRDFIHAFCMPGDSSEDILEKYRKKIVDQFFPGRGFGKLKLGEARKAIRDYRKATGNAAGAAELLMTYVENGARFTHEYGDISEPFYNSIDSVLKELSTLLLGEARELYPQFKDRLAKVERLSDGIGWGFHDSVGDVVERLKEELDT